MIETSGGGRVITLGDIVRVVNLLQGFVENSAQRKAYSQRGRLFAETHFTPIK